MQKVFRKHLEQKIHTNLNLITELKGQVIYSFFWYGGTAQGMWYIAADTVQKQSPDPHWKDLGNFSFMTGTEVAIYPVLGGT